MLGKLIAQRQLPELWKARATLVERFDAGNGRDEGGARARDLRRAETVSERQRESEGARRARASVERERESETPQPEETDGRRDD